MQVVPLGPFALSVAGLLLLAGLVAAFLIDGWLRRGGRPSAERVLWWLFVGGILLARAVFVVRWWPQYAGHPLAMLDVRDGGFSRWTGVGVIVLAAAVIGWRRPRLRTTLAAAVLGGVAVWGLGTFTVARLAAASRPPLPTLTLTSLHGRRVALAGLKGKPVVINLWATWCGPCRKEMPMLVAVQGERPDVHFVFANQGEQAARIHKFLAATGIQVRGVLLDPFSRLSQDFDVRGYPTTLIFDAQGRLRDTHTGMFSRATLADRLHRVARAAEVAPHRSGIAP